MFWGHCAVEADWCLQSDAMANSRLQGCVQGDPTGASSDGPPPLSREQLVSAATIPRRLAYVAKALISFAHHYPGFPGLSAAQLRAGTAAPPGTGGADRLSR